MRKIINVFIFLFAGISANIYPFSYDSAIYTAQKGNMQRADEQLKKIVVNAPDNPDILYDAGVVAHELKNFNQSAAYFNRAAECAAHGNKSLCVRAHFNAGNECVENKDLTCALEHYDKALAIEPDNEFVRHNRDRVAQMLQEQEQQQQNQQQDQDQKDDQENQDDQKDDQKKDQDKKNNKDQQQNGNDQSGDQNNQHNNDGNNGKDQSNNQNDQKNNDGSDQQGNEADKTKQGDNGTEREQQGNTEQNKRDSAQNKERNGDKDFDQKSREAQKNKNKDNAQQHEKSPDKQNQTDDKNNLTAGDKQEQQKQGKEGKAAQAAAAADRDEKDMQAFGQKIDDPWLAGILENQELKDQAMNKRLMEAKIRQQGGKHGQNCW